VTRARSDSQTRQDTYRRSSTGGVTVLLSLAPRPLTGIDSARRHAASPRHRRQMIRSRQRRLKSAPAHMNPDDHAVLKSP
jgi:hypothetical protein